MRFLLTFFVKNGFHSRRTYWMAALGLFPVGCCLLLWTARQFLEREGVSLYGLFPEVGQLLFINVLVPLMAVFVGAAVIADEVEEQTLPYLITRPVPKGSIVLAKLLAGVITLAAILAVSLFLTYTVLVLEKGSGGWSANASTLLRCEGVLLLGLLAYLPLFALMGGTLKRPVLTGLLFSFGWERLVAVLPGNIKLLTIAHYLQVLYPSGTGARSGGGMSALLGAAIPAAAVSQFAAVLILLVIAVVFTVLTMILLNVREYRLEPGE